MAGFEVITEAVIDVSYPEELTFAAKEAYQSRSDVASAGSDFKAAATICRPVA